MKNGYKLLSVCAALLVLSACEMYSESIVSDKKMQVHQEEFSDQVPVTEAGADYVAGVAQKYNHSGHGPVNLTITYDPSSKTNTAMHASEEAARLAGQFHYEGVRNVVTGLLPVREQGDQSMLLVSYNAYQADAGAGCSNMPGFDGPVLEHDPNYRLGCTVDAVFAKQIAHPSDLLGDAKPTPTTDGRGAANIVDVQRSGATNKALEGESSTQ